MCSCLVELACTKAQEVPFEFFLERLCPGDSICGNLFGKLGQHVVVMSLLQVIQVALPHCFVIGLK